MKILYISIIVITVAAVFSTSHASAQYGCPATSGGWLPKIATNDNNVYVAWNYFYGCGQRLLLLKHSNANGDTFGSSVVVANASQAGSDPVVAASNSNVYVAWTSYSANQARLVFKTSTDNGKIFGSAVGLSSNNTGENKAVGIVASGDNVGVIWSGYVIGGTGSDVFLSKSSDNGKSFHTVDLSASTGSSFPSQVVEEGGKAYVLWVSYGTCDFYKYSCPPSSYVATIDLVGNFTANPIVKLGQYAERIAVSGNNVYVAGIESKTYTPSKVEGGLKILGKPIGNQTITFAKSTDGGQTFGKPSSLAIYNASTNSIDNLALDASENYVYVSWADAASPWFSGLLVQASSDDGNTFGDTRAIVGPDAYLNGPEPFMLQQEVSSSGSRYYAIWQVSQGLFFRKSPDGGQTLDNPVNLGNKIDISNPGYVLASNENNLYIAGPDYDFKDGNHIVFSKSVDGGNSFSNAIDFDKYSEIMSLESRLPSSPSMKINSSPVHLETFPNGTYTEAVNFTGNVGGIQKHMLVVIKTFRNSEPYQEDTIGPLNITSDGSFQFDSRVTSNSTSDAFKIVFLYGNKMSETYLPAAFLQQQLNMGHAKDEQQQQEMQQAEDTKNSIFLAEVGIPIAGGVSFAVFVFGRKK
ncbi:MAG: sialidase family protein [Nitrosotalea sp.]